MVRTHTIYVVRFVVWQNSLKSPLADVASATCHEPREREKNFTVSDTLSLRFAARGVCSAERHERKRRACGCHDGNGEKASI